MEYIKDEKLLEKFKKDQHIQLLCGNKIVTDLVIKNGKLTYVKYSEDFNEQLFGYEPIDFEYLYIIFESRIFENNNPKKTEKLLLFYGLNEYDVYDILKITHGVQDNDEFWFKFDKEIENDNIRRSDFVKLINPTLKEFREKTGVDYV